MPSYHQIDLYGGAMTVSIPTDFADVSSIRDVPDHQEVYLSRSGLTSVIFDIVERAEPPDHPSCTTDVEALKYHFEDVIDVVDGRDGTRSDKPYEETKTWAVSQAVFFELSDKPAHTMFATQHPVTNTEKLAATATRSTSTTDFTALILTLLRLPEQKADIIITINVPHVQGERGYDASIIDLAAGTNGQLIEDAMEMRSEILKTFKVLDWNLFVN